MIKYDNCKGCFNAKCEHYGKNREFVCKGKSCKVEKPAPGDLRVGFEKGIDAFIKKLENHRCGNLGTLVKWSDIVKVARELKSYTEVQPDVCKYDKNLSCGYPIEACDECPANPKVNDPYWGRTESSFKDGVLTCKAKRKDEK